MLVRRSPDTRIGFLIIDPLRRSRKRRSHLRASHRYLTDAECSESGTRYACRASDAIRGLDVVVSSWSSVVRSRQQLPAAATEPRLGLPSVVVLPHLLMVGQGQNLFQE